MLFTLNEDEELVSRKAWLACVMTALRAGGVWVGTALSPSDPFLSAPHHQSGLTLRHIK